MLLRASTIVVCVLGLFFCRSESKPLALSNTGCACSSDCSTSWAGSKEHTNKEWCHVEAHCTESGWDWCGDSHIFYAQKTHEGETNKAQVAWLKGQLAQTHTQLSESETDIHALKKKLADARLKESSVQTKLEKSEQTAEAKRKEMVLMLGRQAAEAKALKEELAQSKAKQSDTQKKLQETATKEKQVEGDLQETQFKQASLEKKLGASELKVKDVTAQYTDDVQAFLKFRTSSAKQLDDANQKLANTESTLKKVELARRSVQAKLDETESKRAEAEGKIGAAVGSQQKAEQKQKVAEVKQQNAELRTFRLAVRGAVRGGTGVVDKEGKVERWRIR